MIIYFIILFFHLTPLLIVLCQYSSKVFQPFIIHNIALDYSSVIPFTLFSKSTVLGESFLFSTAIIVFSIIFMNNTVIILNQNSIHFFHIFKRVFLHLYNSTMPQMQITCKINQIIAILLHCEFPHKKSQIPFIHLVSSRPFTSFLSANSVQTSTKSCQISRFLRLRWTSS